MGDWIEEMWAETQEVTRAASQDEWRHAMTPRGLDLGQRMARHAAWKSAMGSHNYTILASLTLWYWANGGKRGHWPMPDEVEALWKTREGAP